MAAFRVTLESFSQFRTVIFLFRSEGKRRNALIHIFLFSKNKQKYWCLYIEILERDQAWPQSGKCPTSSFFVLVLLSWYSFTF